MVNLVQAPIGAELRVARILDQGADFLQFVEQHGLIPGTAVVIQSRSAAADAIVLQVEDRNHITLGTAAGNKILVTVEEK